MKQLGWLLCLAACNELYGLEETQVRPAGVTEADVDRDGVPDHSDLCPGVADDQRDRDGDRFGDACDFCPDVATPFNHDEDADSHGDECDRCPAVPDFQVDTDKDSVGDTCDDDFATQNRLLLFDPFLAIGPTWQPTGTWSAVGDAVTSSDQAQLLAPSIVIDGTKPFAIAAGITTTMPLANGDRYGVELVDEGQVVASCITTCTSGSCTYDLTPSTSMGEPVVPVPVSTLGMRRTPFSLICLLDSTTVSDPTMTMAPVFPRGTLRLVGSPKIQFRYVAVRQ